MRDVRVEVHSTGCRFHFITPEARQWGWVNFDRRDFIVVDIFRSANYVRALEAEGLQVTPGALQRIERHKRSLLKPGNPGRSHRQLGRQLSTFASRLANRSTASQEPPSGSSSLGIEPPIIGLLSTVIISVLLCVRLWHVLEPLLTDIRRWLTS